MYKRTTYACFIGIFMQALITNLTAILFVPLRELYGLDFVQLGILVLVNFSAQVLADILLSRFIDRTPFKRIVLAACGMTAVGLALFACTPWLMPNHFFAGALVATVIFSFASGMCEVVLSPIVDNMPDDGNGNATAMSLMHSFYAWGQVATILLTTLALFVFGRANWQFIVFFWLIVPALCFAFFVRAPIPEGVPAEKRESVRKVLFFEQAVAERQPRGNAVFLCQRQHVPRVRVARPHAPAAPEAALRCAVERADGTPVVKIFPMRSEKRQKYAVQLVKFKQSWQMISCGHSAPS